MKDFFKGATYSDVAPFLMTRQINEDGLELIREYEGLRLKAYRCPGQIWTIGYGHTRTVTSNMIITEDEAEGLLKDDVYDAQRAVSRLIQVPLSDNQFSALVSFTFNVGITNLKKSTLLKLLNRGWYEQVPAQLMRWTKSRGESLGGLSRRRAAESRLWKRGD